MWVQTTAEMKEDLQKYFIQKYYQGDEVAYTQLLSSRGMETTMLQIGKEQETEKETTI